MSSIYRVVPVTVNANGDSVLTSVTGNVVFATDSTARVVVPNEGDYALEVIGDVNLSPGFNYYIDGVLIGSHAVTFTDHEIPDGLVDGNNKVFTLMSAPNPPSSLHLFNNGQLLREGISEDFVLSDNVITFGEVAPTGVLTASYRGLS